MQLLLMQTKHAMQVLQIVFLLSVFGCPQALSLAIGDILEIVNLSQDITIHVTKMAKDVGLSPKVEDPKVLLSEFKVFNDKIDAQLEGIGSQVLNVIAAYADVQSQLKLKLMEAKDDIDSINLKYKDMVTSIESKEAVVTLEEFARSIVSPSSRSLQSVLDRIHAIIAPSSVFKILIQNMKEGNNMLCEIQTSGQQLVLHLYNTLALTELKGFLLMEYSYMILKLQNKGTFTKEIEAAQERYKDRSATTLKLAIEAVQSAPTEFWKCDPHEQIKNETYIEITELLQGFIENEMDLSLSEPCYYTCAEKKETIRSSKCHDPRAKKDTLCRYYRQCNGKIINCHFIPDGTICLPDAGSRNRQIDFISLPEKTLGRRKNCRHNASYNRFKSSWYSCDYCMCICDQKGRNSDRYFSMHSIESKIDDNMVVTGLRFVKKNRIIHLQIQEGKLLPGAKIDLTTVRWKPVETYHKNDHGVRDGEDYHTLTWEKRGFDLDDIVTDEEELVTGVKLKLTDSNLHLAIRTTPFNFATGTLNVGNTKWIYNGISQKDRKKVNLDNKDIPIRSPDHSLPVSKSGMYLEFTHSDWDMDAAQTTVPFIDAQAVAPAQPVPLSGAGVMYKGSKNFGGFIYPKIMTEKLNLDNNDMPILASYTSYSRPLSKPGMYLEFTHSDWDMDAAQTTVPFLDAQAVASEEPVPLSGAGFLYKASENYVGFITPIVRTYDYTKLLNKAYNDMKKKSSTI